MTARRNAMLTTEDRRWLTGEKRYEGEHAKQQRYQRRRDVRERVATSIRDFSILLHQLEPAERRKVFDPAHADAGGVPDDPELTRGVRDGLAFLLHATGIADGMGGSATGVAGTTAGDLLVEAITEAGRKEGYLVERVDLEVEARPVDRDRIVEKLAADELLTPAELTAAIEHEAVDATAIQARVREMVIEGSDGEPPAGADDGDQSTETDDGADGDGDVPAEDRS